MFGKRPKKRCNVLLRVTVENGNDQLLTYLTASGHDQRDVAKAQCRVSRDAARGLRTKGDNLNRRRVLALPTPANGSQVPFQVCDDRRYFRVSHRCSLSASELGDVGDDVELALEVALGLECGLLRGEVADAHTEPDASAGNVGGHDVRLVAGAAELLGEIFGFGVILRRRELERIVAARRFGR